MIYYFSGTGNSLLVARALAEHTSDQICSITAAQPTSDDVIGLVFPVYSWAVPAIMQRFIREQMPQLVQNKKAYVYAVMTCGTDMGFADRLLRKALTAVGFQLNAAFSIIMPNTYVAFPFFWVDSPEEAERRVGAMPQRVMHIAGLVNGRQKAVELKRGPIPYTYTYVIHPLFDRLLLSDKALHVEHEKCIMCGKCIRQCPVKNIYEHDGRIEFVKDGRCTGCTGCFHVCPKNAVQDGRITRGKKQKKVYL